MSEQAFSADQLKAVHDLSPDTKTVVLRKCWSVIFDVNSNAPANATVASFATKELAKQALTLFAAQKDDDKTVSIVIGSKRHYELPRYEVEGYNFDTYYTINDDWQPDSDILRSLADLAKLADCEEDADLPDGVLLTDEDDCDDADDDE